MAQEIKHNETPTKDSHVGNEGFGNSDVQVIFGPNTQGIIYERTGRSPYSFKGENDQTKPNPSKSRSI